MIREHKYRQWFDTFYGKAHIDTSSLPGKFMLTIFGAMYELERETIKQRQAEGIAAAKGIGAVTFGRQMRVKTYSANPNYLVGYPNGMMNLMSGGMM